MKLDSYLTPYAKSTQKAEAVTQWKSAWLTYMVSWVKPPAPKKKKIGTQL